MLISLLLLTASLVRGQYDVTTQGIETAATITPQYMASSNLGHFCPTGEEAGMYLLNCSGATVNYTDGLSSDGNIVVATNHDNVSAVVTMTLTSGTPSLSTIYCRVWNNKSNTTASGNTYDGLRMKNSTVLESTVPDRITVGSTDNSAHGQGLVQRLEANMDSKNLYIAYQTNTTKLGFAVVKLSDLSLSVPPTQMVDQHGALAQGSIPSVACYRWSPLSCHIAFSELASGAWNLVDFQIDATTLAATPIGLPVPSGGAHVSWVRAVCSDNVDATITPFTGYFYAAAQPDMICGTLYYCDGTTVNTISTHLYHDNGLIPDMAVGDPYHLWTVGANLGQSVFCLYKDCDCNTPTTETLKICRQFGSDVQTVYSSGVGQDISYFLLGSNQMGTFALFDNGTGTAKWWRNFQSFDEDIQENTLAAGLCKVNSSAPGLANLYLHQGDTLRIYAAAPRSPEKFQFSRGLLTLHAGYDFSDPLFSSSALRAHIMMDANGIVDYNSEPACTIVAEGRGSWQYDGAVLKNMATEVLGAIGNHNTPDTTTQNKGIIFMNAACTITAGSGFVSDKGEITWPGDAANPYPEVLTVNGNNSYVQWDTSTVYFGSRNTAYEEPNINMNYDGSASGQYMSVVKCILSTQYQNNIIRDLLDGDRADGHTPPDGFCSEVEMYAPDHVVWDNNYLFFVFLSVGDPVSSATYTNNDVCNAQNGMLFYADNNYTIPTTLQVTVSDNSVHETWPLGNNTSSPVLNPAVDIQLDGFQQTNIDQVAINDNFLSGAFPYLPSYYRSSGGGNNTYTGIYCSNGTNCTVTNNQIYYRFPGIHTYGANTSKPFLCNNLLEYCSCDHSGTGIVQDGKGYRYTKANTIKYVNNAYISGNYDNSNLLSNYIYYDGVGMKFADNATTIVSGNHEGTDDYAAWNQIESSDRNEIEVQGSAEPLIGNPSGSASDWGQNIIVSTVPTSTGVLMSYRDSPPPGGYLLTTAISSNQWSPTINTGNPVVDAEITNFNCNNFAAGTVTPIVTYSCGSYGTRGKGDGSTLSTPTHSLNTYPDSLKLYWAAMRHLVSGDSLLLSTGLDTMELYVKLHPDAVLSPGETLDAIGRTGEYVNMMGRGPGCLNWNLLYNWLIDAQTWNSGINYQREIFVELAESQPCDHNAEANMWYNYTLLFTDSLDVWEGRDAIAHIRASQKIDREDTTPFYRLTFPLKKLPIDTGSLSMVAAPEHSETSLAISPNPTSGDVRISYSLSRGGEIGISLYDVLGHVVREVFSGPRGAGSGEAQFNTAGLSPGHYFMRLSTPNAAVTKELIIQR